MRISLIRLGKLHLPFAQNGYDEYAKRLAHYCKYKDELLQVNSKSKEISVLKKAEGEAILKKISPTDFVVLLDENGKDFSSINFAAQLQQWLNQHAHIVFVIGGAYGFSEEVYARAN